MNTTTGSEATHTIVAKSPKDWQGEEAYHAGFAAGLKEGKKRERHAWMRKLGKMNNHWLSDWLKRRDKKEALK